MDSKSIKASRFWPEGILTDRTFNFWASDGYEGSYTGCNISATAPLSVVKIDTMVELPNLGEWVRATPTAFFMQAATLEGLRQSMEKQDALYPILGAPDARCRLFGMAVHEDATVPPGEMQAEIDGVRHRWNGERWVPVFAPLNGEGG